MKKLANLKGVKALSKTQQKSISGGKGGPCNGPGETGQSCTNTSQCIGPGDPVCFNGCCNTWV